MLGHDLPAGQQRLSSRAEKIELKLTPFAHSSWFEAQRRLVVVTSDKTSAIKPMIKPRKMIFSMGGKSGMKAKRGFVVASVIFLARELVFHIPSYGCSLLLPHPVFPPDQPHSSGPVVFVTDKYH